MCAVVTGGQTGALPSFADLQDGMDRGERLAFSAHDDAAMCEADAIRLRDAGLLVNVVDRPELCDFTTPSILERDPVLIAIGTSGAIGRASFRERWCPSV